MTSAPQIVGGGVSPGFGAAGAYARPASRPGEADEQSRRRDSAQTSTQAASPPRDLVRLPGQEGVGSDGPRRPLISGGAFTLAVALGLSLDQQTQPDYLEPATPASAGTDPEPAATSGSDTVGEDGLTEEEQELVRELKARDAEVRRHEAAHAAAGGQYAGSPTYTYQRGPDGRQYAVGGAVSIDTAPVKGDPEATIRKAQQIKAAAAAPADPSSQDRRIAAQADALRQQAQAELAAEAQEERQAEETGGVGAEAPPSAPSGETVGGIGEDDATPPGTDADESQPSSGLVGGAGAFAPVDSGAVAASYRGESSVPRLFSIAV